MTSSIYPLDFTSSVSIDSITVNVGGTGYTSPPTVTIEPPKSGTQATATAVLTGDAVTSINVNIAGLGYTFVPTITFSGGGGSGATATAVQSTISSGNDILSTPITILPDHVKPGGGGILRLYFSFTVASDSTIGVFNNGKFKGNLNADNSALIISDGYYRFDVDVEEGDIINLQSTIDITRVINLRAHLVQFGA